jgi:preprotein translocase subunit SecE
LAKVSPGKFIREVRAETARVVWPTSRETVMTTIMVMLMASILGVFFFGLDSFFSWVVKTALSFI